MLLPDVLTKQRYEELPATPAAWHVPLTVLETRRFGSIVPFSEKG